MSNFLPYFFLSFDSPPKTKKSRVSFQQDFVILYIFPMFSGGWTYKALNKPGKGSAYEHILLHYFNDIDF